MRLLVAAAGLLAGREGGPGEVGGPTGCGCRRPEQKPCSTSLGVLLPPSRCQDVLRLF